MDGDIKAEIGLAVNIIQLVQLSGTVLSCCDEYVAKVNNAPADIQRIISEVGSLKVILEHLKSLTSDPNEQRLASLKSIEMANGPFKECSEALTELERKLRTISDASSIRRRLLWPIEGGKLDDILQSLDNTRPRSSWLSLVTMRAPTLQRRLQLSR